MTSAFFLWMLLVTMLVSGGLAVWGGYRQFGQMGLRRSFISVPIVMVLLVGIVVLTVYSKRMGWSDWWIKGVGLFGALFAFGLLLWIRYRAFGRAGQLLLSLRFGWSNWVYLLFGVFFLTLAVWGWLEDEGWFNLVWRSCAGVMYTWIGALKSRVYEHGLQINGAYFPWSEFKGYRWLPDRTTTLIFDRVKNGKWFGVPINKNQKEEIDQLLAKYLLRGGFGTSDAVRNQQEIQTS